MSNYVNELIKELEKELILLNELHNLLNAEKKLIINNDIEELKQNILLQEQISKEIANCEVNRELIVQNIAIILKLPYEQLTLNKLINFVKAPNNKKILDLKMNISKKINDIQNLRDFNKELIENALNYIGFTLETISEVVNKTQKTDTYSPYGQRIINKANNYQILNLNI